MIMKQHQKQKSVLLWYTQKKHAPYDIPKKACSLWYTQKSMLPMVYPKKACSHGIPKQVKTKAEERRYKYLLNQVYYSVTLC